jgi:hypothetical protein
MTFRGFLDVNRYVSTVPTYNIVGSRRSYNNNPKPTTRQCSLITLTTPVLRVIDDIDTPFMNTRRIPTYQQCSENDNRGADDLVQLNDIVNDDLADDLAILSLPDHIYKNPIKRGSVKYPSTLRDLSTNDMNVIYNQTQRSTRNVSKSKPLQYNEKVSSMKYHSWTSYDSLKFGQGMDKFYDTVVTKQKSLSTNSTEFKKILDILEIKMYIRHWNKLIKLVENSILCFETLLGICLN